MLDSVRAKLSLALDRVHAAPASSHARTRSRPPVARVPTRARRMADEESDKHVRIAWEEALAATMVAQTGEIAGSTVNPANGEVAGETGAGSSMADWYARAAAWAKWNVEPAAGGNKKNEFDAYRAEKIPYIVVARPFSAPPPAPARTPPAPRSRVRPCAPQSST